MKRGLVIATVLLLCAAAPSIARAGTVTSAELVEQYKRYEHKTITFRGEVIGDILARGEHSWVNINNDPYQSRNIEEGRKPSGYNSGQSVWLPSYLVKDIAHTGSYTASGDDVEVVGVFNSACPEHGGDMDIHATSLKVLKRGHQVAHRFDAAQAALALGLLALGAGLFLVNRRAESQRV